MRKYLVIALSAIGFLTIDSSCKKKENTPDQTPPYVVNPRIVAITHSGNLNAGREILFSADKHMNSPSWDFGDGSLIKVEDGVIVSHVYSAAGTYSVTVWAADSTSKGAKTVTIGTAFHDFRYAGRHNVGDTITLSTTESVSASLLWDFGDGTTSTEVKPSHIYDSAGSYRVQLSVNGVPEPDGALYVRVFNPEDTVGRLTASRSFRSCRIHERDINIPSDPGTYFLIEDMGTGLSMFLGENTARFNNVLYRLSPEKSNSATLYFVTAGTGYYGQDYLYYDLAKDSVYMVTTDAGYSELYGKRPMMFQHHYYSSQR